MPTPIHIHVYIYCKYCVCPHGPYGLLDFEIKLYLKIVLFLTMLNLCRIILSKLSYRLL